MSFFRGGSVGLTPCHPGGANLGPQHGYESSFSSYLSHEFTSSKHKAPDVYFDSVTGAVPYTAAWLAMWLPNSNGAIELPAGIAAAFGDTPADVTKCGSAPTRKQQTQPNDAVSTGTTLSKEMLQQKMWQEPQPSWTIGGSMRKYSDKDDKGEIDDDQSSTTAPSSGSPMLAPAPGPRIRAKGRWSKKEAPKQSEGPVVAERASRFSSSRQRWA